MLRLWNCATQYHVKNVTIALDDETHRNARIRAAELGTSLSALVKGYLATLTSGGAPVAEGVRELGMPFKHAVSSDTGPWLIDGKLSYTRDGKPRQPGSLRGKLPEDDAWLEWSPEMLEFFEKLQTESWDDGDPADDLLFDESQLPPQ